MRELATDARPGAGTGQRTKGASRRIAGLEVGVVLLSVPLLLFPTIRPWWTVGALAALVGVWLVRWAAEGRPGARTPLDVSLLLMLMMVLVAVWASAWPELTLPKLTGLILGVAALRAVANAVHRPRELAMAVVVFLALGIGLVAVGLAGAQWKVKLPVLEPLLARMPQLIQGLPGAEGGVHLNTLAGTVLLFLPVSLGACGARGLGPPWASRLGRVFAALLSLVFGMVLLLSQSRGAWMGAAAGLAAMAWVRWREVRWILVAALVLVCVVAIAVPQTALEVLFQSAESAGAGKLASLSTLEGRVEVWDRALYAIGDFAPTGCGLGTFRRVAPLLYPFFLIPPDVDIGHAHNLFLQTALDVGLPGLVGYLALLGTALWMAWRVARVPSPHSNETYGTYAWLALGVFGALVSYHTHGLIDASIALGAKAGLGLWLLYALAAVLWMNWQHPEVPARTVESRGSDSTYGTENQPGQEGS